MGVPGFNTWFARNNRHAYVSYFNMSWDHVYIDMASVLHGAMKSARNLPHFHKILFARLDSIMALATPQKSVMFALDGPAPLAKLLTQRRRRAREGIKSLVSPEHQAPPSHMTFIQPLTDAESTASAKASSSYATPSNGSPPRSKPQKRFAAKTRGLSTMGLTPGTPLMAEIERSLEFYICQRLQKWRHLQFELSGARVQGEGETKIMKRINDSTAHSKGSHVIVGNDSDIILMSLMCPVSKLYILSQQTKGRSTKFECISMDALNMLQSSDVLNGASTPGKTASVTGLNMDLVLIAMIVKGNDYLPAVRGIGGSANSLTLWKSYLRLRQSPQWSNQSLVIVDQGSQTAALNADLLVELLSHNPGPQKRESTAANLLPASGEHYAQGLVWVLNMYLQAECPNYRWTHDNEAPSSQQLTQAVKFMKTASSVGSSQDSTNTGALLPSVCALSLIPRAGRKHMPQLLQPLMDDDSPVADVFDSCSICDQLTLENSQVSTEYMELHAALQAATGEKPRRRRNRDTDSQETTSSSESEASQGPALHAEESATNIEGAELNEQRLDRAQTGAQSESPIPAAAANHQHEIAVGESNPGSSNAQLTASSSAVDDSEPEVATSESDDGAESSDLDLPDLADSESEEEPGEIDVAALRDADIQQMQKRANVLRGQMNSLRHQRHQHMSLAHPYAPFPIARLEKAVAALPSSSLPLYQQELGTFGQSHTFTWASDKQLAKTPAAAFHSQPPAGMTSSPSMSNIIREPVAESRRPASAAATRRTVATSQQVLVQSYMQQQQVWQKHPLARSVLQRDAARQTLWRLAQMPRLHPNGMFHAHRGLVRQAPLQRSLLSRAGLQRMGFGVLP
ncbi:TPA: hypothetical protein ACH3X3_010411 [Trebouxia sp. C0006]